MSEIADNVRKGGGRAMAFGVVTMILGALALAAPLVMGSSIALLVGVLVLVGGVARMIWAFGAGSLGRGLVRLLVGALTLVCGLAMIASPLFAAGLLTIVLAAYFLLDGVFEVSAAFAVRPRAGWGWMLFGGIVSIVLAVMMWRQYPLSGPWAIGVLLGIKLFLAGLMMITLGSAARMLAKEAGA
jgi:uncharacterized membrane protein HdeD (DUF308 family)